MSGVVKTNAGAAAAAAGEWPRAEATDDTDEVTAPTKRPKKLGAAGGGGCAGEDDDDDCERV